MPRLRARGDPHQLHDAVGGDVQVAEEVASEGRGMGRTGGLPTPVGPPAEATCLLTPLLENDVDAVVGLGVTVRSRQPQLPSGPAASWSICSCFTHTIVAKTLDRDPPSANRGHECSG